MEKKLYFRLRADDYDVIMELSGCIEWIKTSCSDIEREAHKDTEESDMPDYIITPVWMTDEQIAALDEVY